MNTKKYIRNSIETKGVTVPRSDTFRDYANRILEIGGNDSSMYKKIGHIELIPKE